MKVSIITPNFNSIDFIEQTLSSVINQTHADWEMIIVDDCSTDKSVELIKKFANKDSRIRIFENKENLGAAKSRNKALKLAKGEFIAFLDSDDVWHKDKLEKQIKFMLDNNYAFTYTYYQQIDESGDLIKKINQAPLKLDYVTLLKSNRIGCLTAMFRANDFKDYLMPDIRKRQDYGLWLKLLRQCNYAHCLPVILASYRVRSNSVSSNKRKLIKYNWMLYNQVEGLSKLKSFYYLSHVIFNKLLNK